MLNCYFRQMKYIPKILLAVILVGLVSCVPSKKMVYLQGADGLEQSPQTIVQDYELKIVPDDQLLITVSSKNGELLEIFSNSQVLGSTGASTTIQETVGLRVDKDGKIEVPILGEAWRGMRISSYTDLILMKLYRTKQIESHGGKTIVSEGIDANYMDMINYALFGLIKLEYGEETVEN